MILPFKRKLISASRWKGRLEIKQRHLSVVVFLVVATALLLAGSAAAQTPCDTADALFKAQLYEAAQINYTDLLKQNSTITCAQNGILAVRRAEARNLYEQGLAYEKASQMDAAKAAYVAVLKIDPNFSNATNALARINNGSLEKIYEQGLADEKANQEARNLYELGQNYENAGQVELARSAYIDALKKNQTFTEAQKALEYLPGGNIPLWRDARNWIGRWGQPVGEIIIFFLGIYFLIFRILPWLLSFCKPRLDIQIFDNKATGLEIGNGMMEMVEESLMQLGRRIHHFRVHLSDGSNTKLNIPADFKDISPPIKIISSLIEFILPSNVITVSGCLEKPGDRGAGLTLSIVMNQTGDIFGKTTIWQKDYDPTAKQLKDEPMPYYCLVEPAAIWILFQLNDPSKIKKGIFCRIYYEIKKVFRNVENYDKVTLQGADWQSYAYLLAGSRWRLEGQDDKARQMFLKVHNRYENEALFNLGVLYQEAKEYERALERLEQVKKDTTSEEILWYMAEYHLALTYRYNGDQNKAKNEAKLLVDTISNTIKEKEGLNNNTGNKLIESLKDLQPMAHIMYANTLVYGGDPNDINEAKSMMPLESSRLTYRARYNLACYYSIYGEKAKLNDTDRNKAYDTARMHLKYALERGGDIVEWAKKDIALKGIREDKKVDFDELVNKYGDKASKDSSDLPLAGIAIIGETYSKILKEQGIVSHCDLILKADTSQAREALAKKLGISTKLLHRWVHLADLMRIVGDTKNVNLLEAADYGSIEALYKVSDSCELANLLNQINKAMSLVSQTPSIETVQLWVQEAKKPEFKVSQKH